MRMRVRRIAQPVLRQPDHLVGHVHSVDLAEMAAQRTHQPPRAAPDFERRIAPGKALQVPLQPFDDVGGRAEKLLVILLAAAKCDVVIRIFARALVPIRAHAL